MRVINDGLPAPLFAAVSVQREPREGYSVSQLVNTTPQMHALNIEHADELEEVASSRIWAAMGSAMHALLAEHARPLEGHFAEERLGITVLGVPVTGQFDVYADGVVTDWKFVGVGSTYGGVKPEHAMQINCYAHLLRLNGFEVSGGEVTYIYRDWMKSKSDNHDYPPPVQTFKIPLLPPEEVDSYLMERVQAFQAAEAGAYPPCTDEERWHRPDEWAVSKKGNKRANRLLGSMDEAYKWAQENAPDGKKYLDWFDIQLRPGADARCDNYCSVSAYCNQYRQTLEARGAAD